MNTTIIRKPVPSPWMSLLVRMVPLSLVLLASVSLMSGCEPMQGSRAKVVGISENELTIRKDDGKQQQTHKIAPDAKITLDARPAQLEDIENGDEVDVKIENRDGEQVVSEIKATSKESIEVNEHKALEGETNRPSGEADDANDTPRSPEQISALPNRSAENSPTSELQPLELDNLPDEKAQPAKLAFRGKVSNLGDNQFAITDEGNKQHSFLVNDKTKYTMDGQEATFGALQVDHFVNVTAENQKEMLLAATVDALSVKPGDPPAEKPEPAKPAK